MPGPGASGTRVATPHEDMHRNCTAADIKNIRNIFNENCKQSNSIVPYNDLGRHSRQIHKLFGTGPQHKRCSVLTCTGRLEYQVVSTVSAARGEQSGPCSERPACSWGPAGCWSCLSQLSSWTASAAGTAARQAQSQRPRPCTANKPFISTGVSMPGYTLHRLHTNPCWA